MRENLYLRMFGVELRASGPIAVVVEPILFALVMFLLARVC